MIASLGLMVLFYRAATASAANDDPDLLPVWGAATVGCTWDNGCADGHHGATTPAVDLVVPEGTAVLAAGNGVARLYEDSCAGKYIEVWHSGAQRYSRYLHLSAYAVRDGETVARGQIIARSGNTGASGGCSTGAHLHYDELDSSHHRIDPGPMLAWSGGTWASYPNALGRSAWNQVPAFTGGIVRNDFTITAGTPTTLLSTTTVPTTPPSTEPSPTATTPTATATTSPAPSALVEGALFRASDAPNVYLYAAGSPWWVPDPAQVELLGGWGRVQVLGPSLDALLTAMPFRSLQYRAFVEAGDPQLYWCAGGSPWPIDTMGELQALQAQTGGSGWHRLPAGAGASQWACGGTLPGTVFRARTGGTYWVWTAGGWASYADVAALDTAGYGASSVYVIPAG